MLQKGHMPPRPLMTASSGWRISYNEGPLMTVSRRSWARDSRLLVQLIVTRAVRREPTVLRS